MLAFLLQFIAATAAIWLMLWVWVKTTQQHTDVMQDVRNRRPYCDGCKSCHPDCSHLSAGADATER